MTALTDPHEALIVEDDPATARNLAAFAASMGHKYRICTTLAEVREAIAQGGYCYVLLDMEIPAEADSIALVSSGLTALELLRDADPRTTKRAYHVLPIIVITGYNNDEHTFGSDVLERRATAYLSKAELKVEKVTTKILDVLARAERADHASCGPSAGSEAEGDVVELAIDGDRSGKRNVLLLNGKQQTLPDAWFKVLIFAMTAKRMTGSDSLDRVGYAIDEYVINRMNRSLKDGVPAGFKLVLTGGKKFQLNPKVRVIRTSWRALVQHDEPAIAKIAREMIKVRKA